MNGIRHMAICTLQNEKCKPGVLRTACVLAELVPAANSYANCKVHLVLARGCDGRVVFGSIACHGVIQRRKPHRRRAEVINVEKSRKKTKGEGLG